MAGSISPQNNDDDDDTINKYAVKQKMPSE